MLLLAALLAGEGLASGTPVCKVNATLGCYVDDNDHRLLPHQLTQNDPQNSWERCASLCSAAGYDGGVSGVEYGVQCFCDHALSSSAQKVNLSECKKMKCPGSHSLPGEPAEYCGNNNRILVYTSTCTDGPNVPNYMPCTDTSPGKDLPFCNASLPKDVRIADFVGRMTLLEKCAQTYDGMGALPKVGWQGYNWNTECLHGLGAICLKVGNTTRCPSIFAAPPLLGATFNTTVAWQVGHTISDEIRAFSNSNGHRSYQNRPIGVSAWGPNLNMYRDPRWGRNVEVPSEDPYHSGQYGVWYTRGLQWGNDSRYTKAIGALKHYTMYSVENGRGSTYFDISSYDIEDTYLPAFKAPVTEAKSLGYMCSYAALTNAELIPDSGEASHPHSEPLCLSEFFAKTKMRDEFGFEGYVQSDCGAVNNAAGGEHWAVSRTDAAAKALVDGLMNSNCGGGLSNYICPAIAEGRATEQDLEARVNRSLSLLMDAGLFDPVESQVYTKIPFDTINSDEAQRRNLEAARQGLVLLKNPTVTSNNHNNNNNNNNIDRDSDSAVITAAGATGSVLPLTPGYAAGEVLLVGPHSQTQASLAGNYYENIGLGTCVGPTCIPTIEASLNAANGPSGGNVRVVQGCNTTTCTNPDLASVGAAAKNPTVKAVVMAMGIDGAIEGEGHDRMDIRLPGSQAAVIETVLNNTAAGVKVILLLFNGGMVTIEDLKLVDRLAVVECWYPGATGGTAVAETLFGFKGSNRFGKLPFTYYAYNFTQKSDFDNMNMSLNTGGPGRTYKYLQDPSLALWPAFYGLSYTTFALSHASLLTQNEAAASTVVIEGPDWATNGSAFRHFNAPLRAKRDLAARLESEVVAAPSVKVTNTGDREGDEVVFLFKNATGAVRASAAYGGPDAAVPHRELIGFARVTLEPGESKEVAFNVTARSLSTVDEHGTRQVLPGSYTLQLSRGHGEELTMPLDVRLATSDDDNDNAEAVERLVLSTMLAGDGGRY